jgi:AcrR family transcriptional regulator
LTRTTGARDADFEQKRSGLLDKLMDRLSQPNGTHPSLRQLGQAAGVSLPTLRHYFGDRDAVVAAVFAEWRRRGAVFLAAAAQPEGGLAESLTAYLNTLVTGFRDYGVWKIIAVGFAEGTLDDRHGLTFLEQTLEPMIGALTRRLVEHQSRGEMIPCDARFAAISLIAPTLILCQHQYQLGGISKFPVDLDAFVADQISGFSRAYGAGGGKL